MEQAELMPYRASQIFIAGPKGPAIDWTPWKYKDILAPYLIKNGWIYMGWKRSLAGPGLKY